jgi:hypothetical protein
MRAERCCELGLKVCFVSFCFCREGAPRFDILFFLSQAYDDLGVNPILQSRAKSLCFDLCSTRSEAVRGSVLP